MLIRRARNCSNATSWSNDYRPVPVAVHRSHQRGDQTAALRIARQYPAFITHEARPTKSKYGALSWRFGAGYLDFVAFHAARRARFRNSRQTWKNAHGVSRRRRNTGIIAISDRARRFYISQDIPSNWRIAQTGKTLSDQQHDPACLTIAALYKSCLQVDQATSSYQTFHRQQRECGENANLVCRATYVLIAMSKRNSKMPRSTLCYRFYRSLF